MREKGEILSVGLGLDEEDWNMLLANKVVIKEFRAADPLFRERDVIFVVGPDYDRVSAKVEKLIQNPDQPALWKVWLVKVDL